jgi:hypothetical protein
MRTAGVALEVISHLSGDWAGRHLRPVGLDQLDSTARAEVVQRLGVGLARVVAERGPLKVVDFYNLDALSSDPSAPVVVTRRPHQRRRPDFAGSDVAARWSLLEAKGRAQGGELRSARLSGLQQVRSVDLVDRGGQIIEPVARVSFVARLAERRDVTVFADDPPADDRAAVYRLDPAELIYNYYALPRELVARVGRAGPRISSAVDYVALPLLGDEQLILGVHRRLLEILDDADALVTIREELRGSYEPGQRDAEEAQDLSLSVGPDGLALASRDFFIQSALEP